ncbi:hypothetical protein DFP72DRAFT_1178895 [Ephemerocybe angulata]|uniref:Uncharacterized protein n=1 Tax=Ephemerocybe angulata TaxID=980116 RepID=A0A8H6H974_9AGAR|nr:hypothetical protein DFP72DRAFT_1178895 [Tulosesus angulatus]
MENEEPLLTIEYDPSLATNNPEPIPAGAQIERWNLKKPSGPKRIRKKQDQAKPRKLKPYERHASILDASGLQQQSVGVPGPSSQGHASGSTLPSHSTAMAPPDPPGSRLHSFGADEMVLDDISMMLDDDPRCSTSFSSTSMPSSSAHPMTAPPTPATHHDQYDPMAWASEPTTPFSKHRQSFDTTSSFPSPSPSTDNLARDPQQSYLLLSATTSDYSFYDYDPNSPTFERSQSVGGMSAHSSFSVSDAIVSPLANMNIISQSTPAPSQAPSRSPSVSRSQKPSKLSVVESVVDILKEAGLTTSQMLLLILETPDAESKKLTNFRNKFYDARNHSNIFSLFGKVKEHAATASAFEQWMAPSAVEYVSRTVFKEVETARPLLHLETADITPDEFFFSRKASAAFS